MTPAQIKANISLELKCTNSQGWRCHRDGVTPETSFREEQNERGRKQFLWTKKGVVIAIISALATIAVLSLTVYSLLKTP
jgi:hypothetical protein